MPTTLRLVCPSCRTQYALPEPARAELAGTAACCAGCGRWWVPLPASSGPPVKLDKGRPVRSMLRLEAYRIQGGAEAGAPAPAPAVPPPPRAAAPAAGAPATARIPVPAQGSPSLRVMVSGPETDLRAVYELGGSAFLIGRQGCHVNLSRAAIPERAIRIRASQRGFVFEGIAGFQVPLGAGSVPAGTIEPGGGGVALALGPYLLGLETSATPGSPIPDLEGAPAPAPPPSPRIRERPTLQAAGPKVDVRDLLQDFAVDVGPGGRPFEERGRPAPAPAEFDGDMTITDMSARGFMATRQGDPLKDLDLQLVRTDGPAAGRSFQVTKTPLVIGRAEGDLIIQDRRVSGKHAQLDVTGPEMYALKDLASTNGTTINGRPISIATLKNGDVIGFGGVNFRFVARVQR